MKFLDFLLFTRVGHFITLITVPLCIEIAFLPISVNLFLTSASGSIILAVYFAFISKDKNKKWF